MSRYRRFGLTLALAAFLAAIGPMAAWGQTAGSGGDTAVVVYNTRDDANIFRFAFMVKRTMQDVVDTGNAAVAVSSCTDCQTVATSFQVVLILSDPDVVTTDNLAMALNIDCSGCATLASAYQFVLTTGGPVRFTAEGNRELAAIRQALIALMKSDLSVLAIQQRLDELRAELAHVLATQLVAAGAQPASGSSPPPSAAPIAGSETPSPSSSPPDTVTSSPTTSSEAPSSIAASESPSTSGSESPSMSP